MSSPSSLIEKTYFWDRVRGGLSGIVETGYAGFALIVAIQVFQAPDAVKSVIAAAGPIGLFLNPLSLSLFSRWGFSASRIAGTISCICGVLMFTAASATSLIAFLIPACLAFTLAAQTMPLLVHVWTVNYPSNKRGAFVSVSMMFSIICTLVFSVLGGWALETDLGSYRWILGIIAAAYVGLGLAVRRIPSTPLSRHAAENPLRNIGYAFSDGKFGIMLLSWMFLGFGNLMVLPLRFEYLLRPQYGVEASELVVTAITLGIPAVFRFSTSRFWGALFDRVDFMIIRMVLNAMIMVSIVMFLTTTNLWVVAASAAVLGTAMAGADISWSLWVTKFAPADRTASYMSVHSFSTGIRGIAAPFLGFYLISQVGATATAAICASLVLISIVTVFCLYISLRRSPESASKTV